MSTEMRTVLAVMVVIIGGIASQAAVALTDASSATAALITVGALVVSTALGLAISAPAQRSTRRIAQR